MRASAIDGAALAQKRLASPSSGLSTAAFSGVLLAAAFGFSFRALARPERTPGRRGERRRR